MQLWKRIYPSGEVYYCAVLGDTVAGCLTDVTAKQILRDMVQGYGYLYRTDTVADFKVKQALQDVVLLPLTFAEYAAIQTGDGDEE